MDKTQIEALKKKHGKVHEISFDSGEKCYLKKPTRATVGLAMSKARTNPLAMVDVILQNCWLGGDEVIREDVGFHVGMAEQIDKIIGTKSATVKNC